MHPPVKAKLYSPAFGPEQLRGTEKQGKGKQIRTRRLVALLQQRVFSADGDRSGLYGRALIRDGSCSPFYLMKEIYSSTDDV